MVRPKGMPILRPTPSWSVFNRRMLIPEEAAPQFLDDRAPRNGMIPPGIILGLAGGAVGLIRSPLWQPQRRIDASGADWDARCARDYLAEGFGRIDARDRAAARHGALDGAGDVEAG